MERPDLIAEGKGRLRWIERALIRFVRRTFAPGLVDRWIRWLQHHFGSFWIHHCTKHLRRVYGVERLPAFQPGQSFVLVANHRSFFDLYVVTAELVRRRLPLRIIFPVRAAFFYDSWLGLFVNGVMSFFAMYPPIFRERRQAVLNVPKGTLLAHLRCAGCGAYLAAVEDQAGLRCYRIGLEVWPLLPPPIACSDHGVMDVDDLNEFLALVSPADDNLPHNIKCPPWVPGSGS